MISAGQIDPRFVDLALALILFEGLGLIGYHALTGRGPPPLGLIANLLAGGFLVLVLREMLVGAAPVWMAASLGAALAAHGLDLFTRWRGRAPSVPRITRGSIALRAARKQENPKPKELGSPNA